MYKHVMLDIETAGVPEPNNYHKLVLSIGVVAFDHTGIIEDSKLHMRLNIAEQILKGRVADPETVEWWQNQPEEAQTAAWDLGNNDEITYFCASALESLSEMIDKNTKVWAKGAIFDITILQSLFEDFDVDIPWRYGNILCMRTLKELVDPNKFKVENLSKHNALDDAVCQAQEVINAKRATGFWPQPKKESVIVSDEHSFYEALEQLNEPDLPIKFWHNFETLPRIDGFTWHKLPTEVLLYAFRWEDTPEDHAFWEGIHSKLYNLERPKGD